MQKMSFKPRKRLEIYFDEIPSKKWSSFGKGLISALLWEWGSSVQSTKTGHIIA